MRILFLTHPYPNYVPDLLLHGLRKLLGPDAVDYPRKDCLYDGVLGLGVCPPDQLCEGWFPSDSGGIDREEIPVKLQTGHFNYVISDLRVMMQPPVWLRSSRAGLAVIDGEDRPVTISPGSHVIFRRETDGSDFSIPLPMALPEELLKWIVSYDAAPKRYSIGFLGSTHDGKRRQVAETITRFYPDALLQATQVPIPDDPKPNGRMGRDAYYRSLQECRAVLSLAGAGFDTFRFWENAACNAIHVTERFPLYIPNDFIDGRHILRFSKLDEFRKMLDHALNQEDRSTDLIREGRYHLVQHHLTTERAKYVLDRLKRSFVS